MKSKCLYWSLISITMLSCSLTSPRKENSDNLFKIVLLNEMTNEVLFTINTHEIKRVNWEKQKYSVIKDSASYFGMADAYLRMSFKFNSEEIYRASLSSSAMANQPPDSLPTILIYTQKGIVNPFANNEFQVLHLDRIKTDQKLYKQAQEYLRRKGLLE